MFAKYQFLSFVLLVMIVLGSDNFVEAQVGVAHYMVIARDGIF